MRDEAGASEASGEWLLFADADVVMDPTALARALQHAMITDSITSRSHPRDCAGISRESFLGTFALLFSMYTKSVESSGDPKAKEYIGIGALTWFDEGLRAFGGHTPIAAAG